MVGSKRTVQPSWSLTDRMAYPLPTWSVNCRCNLHLFYTSYLALFGARQAQWPRRNMTWALRTCISKLQSTRCNVSWFIYFYRCSTYFRRSLRPSSGAHNCTYSFRYCQPILLLAAVVDEMERSSISSTIAASSSIGWQYLKLYVQLCVPDDGRRNRLKHVERL